MAALHSALQALGPTPFSDIPETAPDDANYLHDLFHKAQLIVESIPPPPEDVANSTRARSNTEASVASNASEISSSSFRSAPPSPEYAALQKEWGKPIKLAASTNPLNMSVYKLGGKDGKGAWFARRSVHEGMGFAKWKKGLEMEFPETMEVQGAPGEGNIRGIGGERRVERTIVKGVGKVEVYHLSAQFPGPTTPRDFVTLLITSTTAMKDSEKNPLGPRHYMIISKPCLHPECPPRDGFIRGQYESVEFIREVPRKPKLSASSLDLTHMSRDRDVSPGVKRAAMLRNAEQRSSTFPLQHDNKSDPDMSHSNQLHLAIPDGSTSDGEATSPSRRRGKTISYAESRGRQAKGEDFDNPHTAEDEAETNPVEWIMITRSDPGGSVPRFMVERGTPGSIVADAVKFLDWATKKEHSDIDENEDSEDRVDQLERKRTHETIHFRDYESNGHLAGLNDDEVADEIEEEKAAPITAAIEENQQSVSSLPQSPASISETLTQSGILASVAQAVTAGLEMYAPQVVVDYLPGHHPPPREEALTEKAPSLTTTFEPSPSKTISDSTSISSASSVRSFLSADSHISEIPSNTSKSPSSQSNPLTASLSPHEKELAKLNLRKRRLDEKLAKAREKESRSQSSQTEKEASAIKRAEEKHAKEVQRQEEKYKREVAKLQEKKEKETKKIEEKKRKQAEKDERARLIREKEEMKVELEMLRKEKEIWLNQVKDLQRENTMLTVRIGRLTGASATGTGSDTDASAANTPGTGTASTALAGATATVGTIPAVQGMGSPQKKDFLKDLKDVGGRMRGLTLESMGGSRSRSGSLRREKKDGNSKDGSSSPEMDRKGTGLDGESVSVGS
jgi:hypothetical protein